MAKAKKSTKTKAPRASKKKRHATKAVTKAKSVTKKPGTKLSKNLSTKVSHIPAGYHSVTSYLSVRGAAAAIAFYKKAFGAKEVYRMGMPDGKVGHAELQIEGSRIMLADEFPDMPDVVVRSPQTLGGTTSGLCIYLSNVDARFAKAVAAGATVVRPVTDQFYGDRAGTVIDPFGHLWTLSTHIEDLSHAQIKQRVASMHAAGST